MVIFIDTTFSQMTYGLHVVLNHPHSLCNLATLNEQYKTQQFHFKALEVVIITGNIKHQYLSKHVKAWFNYKSSWRCHYPLTFSTWLLCCKPLVEAKLMCSPHWPTMWSMIIWMQVTSLITEPLMNNNNASSCWILISSDLSPLASSPPHV